MPAENAGAKNYFSLEVLRVIMAKSSKKKKTYSTKGIGKYRIVMTDRVRILLIACFVCSFLVFGAIAVWLALSP